MSKQKKSFTKNLEIIFEKINLETFEAIATEILESRNPDNLIFDISVRRSVTGMDSEIMDRFSKKYKVNEALLQNMLGVIASLLRTLLMGRKESALKEFKKNAKLADRASKLFEIGENLLKKFPNISNRFFVASFSKTYILEDLDWEVVLKVAEPLGTGFEKKDRFQACVLRFLMEKSPSLMGSRSGRERKTEFVFEASLDDINKLIMTLSNIKERMMEMQRELNKEETEIEH